MDTNTRIRLFSPSMARTNYKPEPAAVRIRDGALSLAAVAAIAILLSFVGPAMDGVIAEVEAEQRAQEQLQRQAWAAAAAQRQCGGEESTWVEIQPGIVDCYDKRGRRTVRNVKVQP